MTKSAAFNPGDVVLVDFPGVTGIKRRPAVVVSTSSYHTHRPDVIIGIITSQLQNANTPSDHILADWQEAGLHAASAFRAFLITLPQSAAKKIGHITEKDFIAIQRCLIEAITISNSDR